MCSDWACTVPIEGKEAVGQAQERDGNDVGLGRRLRAGGLGCRMRGGELVRRVAGCGRRGWRRGGSNGRAGALRADEGRIITIRAFKVGFHLAATFLRGAERFEAGGGMPLFVVGFGEAEVGADDIAEVMKGGSVVFEDRARGAAGRATEGAPQAAAERPPTGGLSGAGGEQATAHTVS